MKRTITTLVAALLALCMILSVVACGDTPAETTPAETTGGQTNPGTFTPVTSYEDPAVYTTWNGGKISTTLAGGASGGTINTVAYAGLAGKDYTDTAFYTYNDYMSGMGQGLDWNPHTWETNEDSIILDYITMGFYSFVMNADKTGYSIVPEMASEYPVDVTSDYVGSFGVSEGETGKAWKIALNKNATWEDGTPINADTYIYSMQQQLNPYMLNRRADSYYAGDAVIVGAKGYLYSAGGDSYDLVTDVAAALAAGDVYLDMDFWGLIGCLDKDGNACPQYVLITDETMYRDPAIEEGQDEDWVSAKYIYDTYLAAGAPYESYAVEYLYTYDDVEPTTWEDVGLLKLDDYTLVIIYQDPIEEASFYVPYNLSSSWLVYEPLYEACKSYWDADGNQLTAEQIAEDPTLVASITTDYCKSVDKTMGYGPYKLTAYELDKQITLERNDNWYGYKDGKHLGQYQTDKVSIQVIKEHKTALLAFLNGEIDGVSLQSDDMATYASSDRIVYTPESYTTKVSFNTNYEKLLSHGTNSQILAVKEFREAFAYAVDKTHFASAFTSAGEAGYGLLNYMYCYNPFTGALYRDSDAAKKAIVDLFELTYGEGGDFDTLDEAYDAVTGFDMEKASSLMQTAYDKAVAAKIYDGTSPITIDFRVYQSDEIYVKMFTYFNEQVQAACKGTSFEGKVSLTMTVDADYYESMYAGNADVIFTTWGGAAMSPFTMMSQCYTDASDGSGNQNEVGYKTENVPVLFNIDGTDYTYSLKDWADWAGAVKNAITDKLGNFANYSYETRCDIYASLENIFLSSFSTFSVYYRNVASLNSRKVEQASENYLQLIGFGGLQYVTYNYDDAAWATVKANQKY